MDRRLVYFVEGEDEITFIKALKADFYIPSGAVRAFNIVNRRLSNFERRQFKKDELAVFVFDTDVESTAILEENIRILDKDRRDRKLKDFKFIMQVRNLEDEILRSCKIGKIREFFGTRSDSDFKSAMAQAKSLHNVLLRHEFDFSRMWNTRPGNCFDKYLNRAFEI